MAKVKLGTLVQSEGVFDTVRSLQLSGTIVIDVRKNLKPFVSEIELFKELRQERILQYKKPDASGKISITIGEPGHDEIKQFITEMFNKIIEIDIKNPVSINDLVLGGKISNDELDYLVALGFAFDPDDVVKVAEPAKVEPTADVTEDVSPNVTVI